MTAWQRLINSWRTNSPPQTFLLLSTDCTDFSDLYFCVISVICWLFIFNNRRHKFSQRDWTKYFFVFFCVICCFLFNIGWNGFHGFWIHSHTCLWINFCPLSPKLMNSYNSLIIIDITSYLPIKSPKIHPKSLLLYIFSANFLSYPSSKLPDPNNMVSSINAYGVNSWHLVSCDGLEKATKERKTL